MKGFAILRSSQVHNTFLLVQRSLTGYKVTVGRLQMHLILLDCRLIHVVATTEKRQCYNHEMAAQMLVTYNKSLLNYCHFDSKILTLFFIISSDAGLFWQLKHNLAICANHFTASYHLLAELLQTNICRRISQTFARRSPA